MMLNYLTLWRGYVFGKSGARAPKASQPHSLSEWAAFRRAMQRSTSFRPTYR